MAELSSASMNDLPDSAFAYIEPGGTKDSSGKTTPRGLRHFPIHDKAHAQNALSRAPQSPFGEKAMPKIKAAAKKFGVDVSDDSGRSDSQTTLTRGYATDLTIDGRTIVGLAVPFNRVATVSDDGRTSYKESFAPGSFTRTLAHRGDKVRIFSQHKTERLPIGKASKLEETGPGLEAHLRVSDTSDGNDVLTLVRDGVLTGLSVGFRGLKHELRNNVRVRTEVTLSEISIVTDPAYPDAQISGIRAMHDLDLDEYVDARVREYFATHNDPATETPFVEDGEVTDDPRAAHSIRSVKQEITAARTAFLLRYPKG